MRSGVKFLAVWGTAGAIIAAAPTVAAADPGGWVPSFSVNGGVTIQEQEASVVSTCEFGGLEIPGTSFSPDCIGHAPPGPAPLRPAADGTDWVVDPIVGFDLQLMTPTIPRIPGRPRLFAWGEIQLSFGSTHNTANEGNPVGVGLPGIKEGTDSFNTTPTTALTGVGHRTTTETQTLGWGAGAGIAFPFRFLGRQLWVKPGFAWTRYTVDVEGVLVAGLKNDPKIIAGANAQRNMGSELREITFSDSRSMTYDGIGPSFDLEMDVGHFGPIGASLFLGAQVYRILGERSVEMTATESFPEGTFGTSPKPPGGGLCIFAPRFCHKLPADTYTTNWSHEIDPWRYRARAGMRFSWLGM